MGIAFLSPTFSQEKGDLGFMVTTSDRSKISLEYRKPVLPKLHLTIGATYGSDYYYYSRSSTDIIEITDSTFVQRAYQGGTTQAGIRIGVERQMKESIFSFGVDLNLNYRRRINTNYNTTYYYDDQNGIYDEGAGYFPAFDDGSYSSITRHYLVPGLRGTFNMNIPLGESFILTLSSAVTFSTPVYMGATSIIDPDQQFIGTSNFIFDMSTNLGIGLRYNIGSIRKNKANK